MAKFGKIRPNFFDQKIVSQKPLEIERNGRKFGITYHLYIMNTKMFIFLAEFQNLPFWSNILAIGQSGQLLVHSPNFC